MRFKQAAVNQLLSLNSFLIRSIHCMRMMTMILLGAFVLHPAMAEEVGGISGSFSVSPTGGASYTIPFIVPPGTAGMTPSLALSYNSQAGNGLLGVGWMLSGLSSITRCHHSISQDGATMGVSYTSADKYCLDGQRLVAVNGVYGGSNTEYRTERETYTRVISYAAGPSGPAYFKAWTKAGQIIEFGNTADSAIQALGKSAIRVWAVNAISDSLGNYLKVQYGGDGAIGEYYPVRIDYTGNISAGLLPYNSVQFEYQSRPDIDTQYVAGSSSTRGKRLATIRTYVVGQTNPVKVYNLTYELSALTQRSRLVSLSECDGEATSPATKCLNPTTFEWAYAGLANSACQSFVAPGFCSGNILGGHGISTSSGRWVDMNGDGRSDYITSNLSGVSSVSLSISGYSNRTWSEPLSSPRGAFWIDMNADGKADMVNIDTSGVMHVSQSNGSGYLNPITINTGTTAGSAVWTIGSYPRGTQYTCTTGGAVIGRVVRDDYPARCEGNLPEGNIGRGVGVNSPISGGCYCPDSHYFADLNGDGLPDYIAPDSNGVHHISLSTNTPGSYINTSWNAHILATTENSYLSVDGHHWVDLNGDRLADYVTYDAAGNHFVSLSTGSSYAPVATWTAHAEIAPKSSFWADLNGDGNADYITLDVNGNHYVSLSNGIGYEPSALWAAHPKSDSGHTWVDLNGDGKADYVTSDSNGHHYVSISTGTGYQPAQTWTSDPVEQTGWNWADINGDGTADYLTSDASGNHHVAYTGLEWQMRDGISRIVNGQGATVDIEYQSLSSAFIPYPETTESYPVSGARIPIYVVTKVSNSDGIGGKYVSDYRYVGGKLHLAGGGFLGFAQTISTDAQTGLQSITSYTQDYPHQGLIQQVEKRTASNGLLNNVVNTWEYDTGFGGQYHAPKLTQTVESSYELSASGNGVQVTETTTDTIYDTFGNAKDITTHTSDGFTKVTNNIYENDTVRWFLGRLKSATVSSTSTQVIPVVTPTPAQAVVSIAALDANKFEGNVGVTPFTFTVVRTGNQNISSTVHWKVSGSGIHPAEVLDFGGTWPEGNLVFNGISSQTLTINVPTNDIKGEDDGFTVTLSAPSVGTSLGTSSASGVIKNDDVLKKPVISIAALNAQQAEGNNGVATPFTFTLTRSMVNPGGADLKQPASVQWTITGNGPSPADATDFVGGAGAMTGTVTFSGASPTFPDGESSKTLTVNVFGDNNVESNEGFIVTLSNVADATLGTSTATGEIQNDASDAKYITLAATGSNYNLWSKAVAAGWNQTDPLNATVNLNSGDVISATATTVPAFTIDGAYPAGSAITLNIAAGAYIVGKGGAGGYPAGLPGGAALKVASTGASVRINNKGLIGGGGGGGGNALKGWSGSCDNGRSRAVSLYGGGGAGYGPGPGNPGGLTTGGAGVGTATSWSTIYPYGAMSGAGGVLGAAGLAGSESDGNCGRRAVPGGAAGPAVIGMSKVSWGYVVIMVDDIPIVIGEARGTLLGALQ